MRLWWSDTTPTALRAPPPNILPLVGVFGGGGRLGIINRQLFKPLFNRQLFCVRSDRCWDGGHAGGGGGEKW